MIRQTIIPTSNTYTLQLQIPDSMIGKKVEVSYEEEGINGVIKKQTIRDVGTLDIEHFFDTKKIDFNNIEAFYKSINLNFGNNKFNRDDANER